MRAGTFIDLTGQTFDQLRVIEFAGMQAKPKATLFSCRCSCGRKCVRTSVYLRHAARQSCRACAVQKLSDNGKRNVARMQDEAGLCSLCRKKMKYPSNLDRWHWARRGAVCRRCTRKLKRLESEE